MTPDRKRAKPSLLGLGRVTFRGIRLLPYGVAPLSVALALGSTLSLGSLMRPTPTQLFFVAVMVSAWYGGLGPGLLATALSTLAVNYFFIEPHFSLNVTNLGTIVQLAVFTMAALLISGLNESRRTSLRQAKASLQTLHESETRFSRLAETNILGIIVADMNGSILEANDAFLQMVGYTREELQSGRVRWRDMTPPESQQVSERAIQELRMSGVCTPFEQDYIRKDDSRIPILFGAAMTGEHTAIGFVLDLSEQQAALRERKQADAALRESEARFRHMTDTAPTMVWMSGTDKLCNYFNKFWLDFTGRTIEQELGNGWAEGVHCDDFQLCLKTYVNAFDAHQDFAMEYRLKRFDGEYRWIFDIGVPRFTPEGNFLGYIGSCIDITARIQAEEAVRQSEQKYRHIVETASEGIWIIDAETQTTYVNQQIAQMLGYVPEEMLGHSPFEFIYEADWTEAEQKLEQRRQGIGGQSEFCLRRRDGTPVWVLSSSSPMMNENGEFLGVLSMITDITNRKRADERLHLLYETTRDLLGTEHPMQLMSNLFSKLSNQLELHEYYNYMVEEKDNQSMLHLRNYGGISDEVAQSIEWIEFGQYLCGLVAQERRQIVLDRAQIVTHPNAQLICSTGITAYAGQPLIVKGRLLGTLSLASRTRTCFTSEELDLLQSTCEQMAIALERVNLTTSIQQQAEQLQQANRIKDEFLAVLSHELRSPLNPILGWSKLLQTRKLDETKTAQALSVIERNAKLQSELIEDLLDVSRILQGKLSLNVSPVDLVTTVQASIETVRLAAEAKSIQIQARLDPNLGQVLGDPNRLQQVTWNLLSNAVKFTDVGGEVNVRLERLDFQTQISVSDTGRGIHPDFLPNVFDYFRQADSATTRKFGGLGLGLAIVRHLVELHGGTVQAESPGEGQGATFTVKLPLMPNPHQTNADSKPSELSLNLQGIKVLVVDDDTDTRELMVFLLEQAEASVISANSAGEAFAALMQSKPDILLSDIGMPDMDGYMLMRQVRALSPEQGGQIPAIALTAYAGDFNQQRALQAGFQRHIAKPLEPNKLIKTIATLIGKVSDC